MEMREQIERRRQRAVEEIAKVVNRGDHPFFSTFEVASRSGRTYRVQIRSLTDLQNSCTCPDYRTNLVGTCKHIEGVLIGLKAKAGRRLREIESRRPAIAQVYLHYGEEVAVRASVPPGAAALRQVFGRYFDGEGVLQGAVTRSLPALLHDIDRLPPKDRASVQVAEEVREHLDLLQDQEAIQKQKEWFLEQAGRGNRSLHVLSARLYPYQEQGALHLAFGRRAMLADDMGLGKTLQAIAACALLRELRDIRRVLVITPASLKYQWAREIRRFTSLPAVVVEGNSSQRRDRYGEPAFFTIVNYELVRRDLPLLEQAPPDVIVLDEAQRIKNWRAKTADAVKRLRSRYAFVLTGTPLENRLDELYSIFQFLDPRVLGPLWKFNERYFQVEKRGKDSYKVLGYKNLDELRARVAPYVLRRTKEEVLRELPERIDNNYFVEMTPQQMRVYDEYRETVARLAARARKRPLTPKEREILLRSLLKMRIICNALALHDPAVKPHEVERTAPKLREFSQIMLDQLGPDGSKAVVFSQWSGMLDLVEPALKRLGLGFVKLTGDVPSSQRGRLIERFFDDPACRVFLSTDAGGVGLNLQAASLVINLDLPWNPAVLDQRVGRAHRHGQQRAVNVINLIARGTIEERILDTLAVKRNVFGSVFGTQESPREIAFRDVGQDLLKRLDELLEEPRPEPAIVPDPEIVRVGDGAEKPPLRVFADVLVARLAGRVLLVRRAPIAPGFGSGAAAGAGASAILVVVDREPAELRPTIEAMLGEWWSDGSAPALHVVEVEGYRALAALARGFAERGATGDEAYRAPALPLPADDGNRLRKAREGFESAASRLRLAEIVLQGGFPEEAARPIREAAGWALSSHLALAGDRDPQVELPSAREVQAGLVDGVDGGRLPDELAGRVARLRELTEPAQPAVAAGGGFAPVVVPLTAKAAEMMIATVRDIIELGEKAIVARRL